MFSVELSMPENVVLGSQMIHQVTIFDDDVSTTGQAAGAESSQVVSLLVA